MTDKKQKTVEEIVEWVKAIREERRKDRSEEPDAEYRFAYSGEIGLCDRLLAFIEGEE